MMDMNDTPQPIIDTPNQHGMFMLGTTSLYLCHMPMFTKEDHCYQVTLNAHLDQTSSDIFLADRAKNPGQVYNLANNDNFILPDVANGTITSYQATVYRGYSNEGGGTTGPAIIPAATVYVDRVVVYRHFNQNIPRPGLLTYVLFGDEQGVYLDHYIAQDPDYQHLLVLPGALGWLSLSQLKAGVAVSFVGMESGPPPCQNPLTEDSYEILFEGQAGNPAQLSVGADATYWFSTGNMLNTNDPCAPPSGMPSK
jgi:hypothetical protein